jgi:hypothetical protein
MTTLSDALSRIVHMELEITGASSDAKLFFFYSQEAFPYWTNRVGPFTRALDSQEFYVTTYSIILRLVIGHLSEGYDGALETTLQTVYIPQTLDYFSARTRLQNLTDTTPMVDIDPRGILITGGTGLSVFEDSGIGVQQIGTEFTLELPIEEQIAQAF